MADIELSLGLDSKEAEKNIKQFGREASNISSGISKSFAGIAAGIGAAITAFAGFSILKDVTEAASVQQDAINKLNQSLKTAGTFSNEASLEFQTFASELQKVTTVGDETTLELAALARNFTQTNDQAKQLTEAAIQLSAATGQDLTSSVELLGRTFGGSLGRLTQTLPALKGLSQEALASGAAIQFVLDRFGGSAQAQLQTFSGVTTALANNFGDLKEEIGFSIIENEALIIVLNKVNEIFISLGGAIKDNRSVLSDFVTGAIKFFLESISTAADVVQFFIDGWFALIGGIKAANIAFAEFAKFIITGFAETVRGAFEGVVVNGISIFREFVVGLVDLFQEIPGFDKFFPDFSKFVDDELGAVQLSFENTGKQISINGQKIASSLDGFIQGQANTINENEKSRLSFQEYTNTVSVGAADAVNKINNIGNKIKDVAKDSADSGKKISENLVKPIAKSSEDGGKKISEFIKDIERQSKPLEQQIVDVGTALTEAYNADDFEEFKRLYQELITLQGKYKKGIEDVEKAQEEASKKAIEAINAQIKAQEQQAKDFGIGVASALLSGDSTSQQTINELETDIARLSESLNNAEISEDKRLEIQEEILAKEKEIAKARESQRKSTGQTVAQIGGLVTDIFLPGFGGIASQLLTVLSGGPEQVKALITGLVEALPAVIDAIAESIPVIIEVLVDKAPEIIDALTSASPKIIAKLVEKAPDIIATLVKRAPEIAAAVVRGILRETFKVNFDFTDLQNKFDIAVQKVVDAFSNLPLILGQAVEGLLNSIANAGLQFATNIVNGAGQFIGQLVEGIKRQFGLGGGGGGDDRGLSVNNLSVGGLKNSISELEKRSGVNIPGLGLTSSGFETARDFQQRAASNQELRDIIDRLGDAINQGISSLVQSDNQRPLVIQLQVGQAQLANVLLQLNRNGFRTA